MSVMERPVAVDEVVQAVRGLAPTITGRAREIEANRDVPADLLAVLIDAGCFRIYRPASHGGYGFELGDSLRVVSELCRVDGSTGWTVMIGAASWLDLAALPRSSFDELFADPDAIVAGAFAPSGTIAPDGDHYRVSGRWAFASGCRHADRLFGNCIAGVVDGVPEMRIAAFRPDQVEIEDTWHVSGLRGTGSHHFHANDVAVEARWTAQLAHDPDDLAVDDPAARVPAPTLFALMVAAAAVGIGRGALDDILAIAVDKVPLLSPGAVATNPVFHTGLATADIELAGCEALLADIAGTTWQAAIDGRELTLDERTRARSAAAWVADRAASAVGFAYRAGGGASLHDTCPLQRRLRDVHAVTQHFLVRPDTLATAGAVIAGQGLAVPVW